jgi:hypothetical protein
MPSEHNSSRPHLANWTFLGPRAGEGLGNRRLVSLVRGEQNAYPDEDIAKGGKALGTNGEVRANACLQPLALGLT